MFRNILKKPVHEGLPVHLYNTLGKEQQAFELPAQVRKVRMYNCGPTVYGVQHIGNLFSCFFLDETVTDFDIAQRQDTAAFGRFFHSLLDQGVSVPPSAYEAWFVSSTHDDEAMGRFADALPAAARAAAGGA